MIHFDTAYFRYEFQCFKHGQGCDHTVLGEVILTPCRTGFRPNSEQFADPLFGLLNRNISHGMNPAFAAELPFYGECRMNRVYANSPRLRNFA